MIFKICLNEGREPKLTKSRINSKAQDSDCRKVHQLVDRRQNVFQGDSFVDLGDSARFVIRTETQEIRKLAEQYSFNYCHALQCLWIIFPERASLPNGTYDRRIVSFHLIQNLLASNTQISCRNERRNS